MATAVEEFGGLFKPEKIPDDSEIVYDRALAGRCMTCGCECGEQTTIVGNQLGVIMIYCTTGCMGDMAIRGYLEEQYGDLVDKIKFRAQGSH